MHSRGSRLHPLGAVLEKAEGRERRPFRRIVPAPLPLPLYGLPEYRVDRDLPSRREKP